MKHLFFVLALFVLVGCVDPQAERQQAIARQQEAQSAAVVAQSNASIASSKAEVERFQILAQAAKPDYTPIYVFLLVVGVLIGTFIYWQGKQGYMRAEAERWRELNYRQPTMIVMQPQMQIPGPVAEAARLRGGFAQWDGDAGRWLIVDHGGRVLARQKLLTGA